MSYECDNDNHAIGCQCPGVDNRREAWTKALNLREDEIEEFRIWWQATHSQYNGMISRQSLVLFCQKKAAETMHDSDLFYESSTNANLNHAEQLEMLREYSSCLGEVRALRKVCEWAKEQKTDG